VGIPSFEEKIEVLSADPPKRSCPLEEHKEEDLKRFLTPRRLVNKNIETFVS
jgi:hypothetical protein